MLDVGNRLLDVGQVARLGHHQVGQPVAGAPDQGFDIGSKSRVVDWMDSRADPAETVLGREGQFGAELGVFGLSTYRRAVLAVERDVEHWAELGLQRQAFSHPVLDAAVVVTHREVGREIVFLEQGVAGQGGGCHGISKWKKGCQRYADQPLAVWPKRANSVITAGV